MPRAPPAVAKAFEFTAAPGSPEFVAWIEYAKKAPGKKFLHKYLTEERAKSQPFTFESQWPPGYDPLTNGKAAP